jgi:hypothetical protein
MSRQHQEIKTFSPETNREDFPKGGKFKFLCGFTQNINT